MDLDSSDMQWRVREHLAHDRFAENDVEPYGIVSPKDNLYVRWNSQDGYAYIDGHHVKMHLQLGDELEISTKSPPLKLFCSEYDTEPTCR